jgi:hypothetical protein
MLAAAIPLARSSYQFLLPLSAEVAPLYQLCYSQVQRRGVFAVEHLLLVPYIVIVVGGAEVESSVPDVFFAGSVPPTYAAPTTIPLAFFPGTWATFFVVANCSLTNFPEVVGAAPAFTPLGGELVPENKTVSPHIKLPRYTPQRVRESCITKADLFAPDFGTPASWAKCINVFGELIHSGNGCEVRRFRARRWVEVEKTKMFAQRAVVWQ